jgi:hypothetical protein
MFDVQVLEHRRAGGDLPAPVLESISAYYARVTTAARPMNRLVAAVMVGTIAAIVVQIAGDDAPEWVGWSSLALAVVPIGLAGSHTVPNAVRLGGRGDEVATQSALARSICRDHLVCAAGIAALLVVQLAFAA